jgi:Xaa-Pro aminopeptidase
MTDVFSERRRAVMDRIGDGVLVLLAAPETYRNADVHHSYRQDSDFWYLTGFPEPDAILVLCPSRKPESVLFVRPRDKAKEVWNGVRAGPEGAVARFGMEAAFALEALDAELPKLIDPASRLHTVLGRSPAFDRRVLAWIERGRNPRAGRDASAEIVDATGLLHEMRLRKTPGEIASLRRAAALSASAHLAAMRAARPGIHEYEIQALIEYVCRSRGSARLGYPSIVGAGEHATILHYVENDAEAKEGDLVLVDAGCEVDYYTADVTRTWPVSGRFTPPQKRLYEIVLRAQLAAIDVCRPGRTMQEAHDVATRILVDGMIEVGLIAGDPAEIIKENKHARCYMHKTSHWLGLDVHDAGRYVRASAPRPLEPGFVLTVEPGLYVATDDAEAPPEYRGIGIRIEDDVLVTEGGPEVLTAAAPKTVADLERECSRRLPLPVFG